MSEIANKVYNMLTKPKYDIYQFIGDDDEVCAEYEEFNRCVASLIQGYRILENSRPNQWISVEEELPKIDEDVWVNLKDGKQKTGFLSLEKDWIVTQYGEDTVGEGFYENDSITHWMPLPAPSSDNDEEK